MHVHDTTTATFYPTYDGNGNISEYLTNNSGTVVAAHFEYDPFGNLVVNSFDNAADFPYRFSTKPQDLTTGLYYYGYRWYDPVTGRWPSRDPIGERGGLNLYVLVRNNPLNYWDFLGLATGIDGEDYASCGRVNRGGVIDSDFEQGPIRIIQENEEFLRYDVRQIHDNWLPHHVYLVTFVRRTWLVDWTLYRVWQYCVKEECDGSLEIVRVEGTELDDRSRWIIFERWEDEQWRAVAIFTPDPE